MVQNLLGSFESLAEKQEVISTMLFQLKNCAVVIRILSMETVDINCHDCILEHLMMLKTDFERQKFAYFPKFQVFHGSRQSAELRYQLVILSKKRESFS